MGHQWIRHIFFCWFTLRWPQTFAYDDGQLPTNLHFNLINPIKLAQFLRFFAKSHTLLSPNIPTSEFKKYPGCFTRAGIQSDFLSIFFPTLLVCLRILIAQIACRFLSYLIFKYVRKEKILIFRVWYGRPIFCIISARCAVEQLDWCSFDLYARYQLGSGFSRMVDSLVVGFCQLLSWKQKIWSRWMKARLWNSSSILVCWTGWN